MIRERFDRFCAEVMLTALAYYFDHREVTVVEPAGKRFAWVHRMEGEEFIVLVPDATYRLGPIRRMRVHFSRLKKVKPDPLFAGNRWEFHP